jgi:hypothetical protein
MCKDNGKMAVNYAKAAIMIVVTQADSLLEGLVEEEISSFDGGCEYLVP